MHFLNLLLTRTFRHQVSEVKDTLLEYIEVESAYTTAVVNQIIKYIMLITLSVITVFALISSLLVITAIYLLFFLPISYPEITHQVVAIWICFGVIILLASALTVTSIYVAKTQLTFGQYYTHWRS